MRVLFVTSEVAPLIKTGGLADVSAALPVALRALNVDVRILLPGYTQVLKALHNLQVAADFPALPGYPSARILVDTTPSGVPIWIIECPMLYQRGGGAYQNESGLDWPDNAHRFGLLSKIAALLSCAETPLAWKPDVVHCNDWQSGLTPAYLHFSKQPAPSVMTVHNIAFQGLFPPQLTAELGLPEQCFQSDGVEFYGKLSFMKAGLFYADHITTVSPTYAQEIQTAELGFGLHGLLAYKNSTLSGILNGIDINEWNPAADPYLTSAYDAKKLNGKAANKKALQHAMGLHLDAQIPLLGMVGRFTEQKGLDLLLEVATQLIALPAQLVLLGSGDAEMERSALALAHQHPGEIATFVGFDESLAHMIEAGADIFLMPSRFEPCGLNQLYSQRYGTPPIVHATGGLIDTVVDCNATSLLRGNASGFVFNNMGAPSLMAAARRAVAAYHDQKIWPALQRNCMNKDFSWRLSAAAYHDIYSNLRRK